MCVAIPFTYALSPMDANEFLEYHAAGIRAFRSVDLEGVDLSGVDLSGVDLSRADLRRADLRGANLDSANLSRANLKYANLSGANFANADLWDATLKEANLSSANFTNADLSEANLIQSDLSGANLSGADLFLAFLSKANLQTANLRHGKLKLSVFLGADLRGADLSGANLQRAIFIETNLESAKLLKADLREANLVHTKLNNADLSDANLVDANLAEVDLTDANLNGAKIDGTILVYQKEIEELQQTNRELTERVKLLEAQLEEQKSAQDSTEVSNQGVGARLNWQGLHFRSEDEIRIAEALDHAGVLFYPNCKARLNASESRDNKQSDFLVLHSGKWGILEVDGRVWHQTAADDHERDRLFKAHGIRVVERYDAERCGKQPDQVVREFLAILSRS